MKSPIDILLKADRGGTAGQIVTPGAGTALAYDPASSSDFAPAAGTPASVQGVWSDGYQEGMAEGEIGHYLIPVRYMPADCRADLSTLVLASKTFRIVRIRTRVYRGAVDGYNLYLAA